MAVTTTLDFSTLLARFVCEPVTLQELAAECGMPAPQFAYMLHQHARRHGQTSAYEQAANRTHAADVARRAAEQAAREARHTTLAGDKLMLLTACKAWADWLDHSHRCRQGQDCHRYRTLLGIAERLNRRALDEMEDAS